MYGSHSSVQDFTASLEPKLSQNPCLKHLDSAYIFACYLSLHAYYRHSSNVPASNTAFIISLKRIVCFAHTIFRFEILISYSTILHLPCDSYLLGPYICQID
jgi:hypothetical protein